MKQLNWLWALCMVCTQALRAQCVSQTFNFSGTPSLIAGTALQTGAQYRYPNAIAGVDVVFTLVSQINGGGVANIDELTPPTAPYAHAWQPSISAPANVNGDTYVEWRVNFYATGTVIPSIINCLSLFAVDVDGNNNRLREFYQFDGPYNYRYPAGSTLTISNAGASSLKVQSTTTDVYDNIDSTVKAGSVQVFYRNVSTITFRTGNNLANTGENSISYRNFCLFFTTTSYNLTRTRFFRTDNDAVMSISSTGDLDDDNDGIVDAREFSHTTDPFADRDNDGLLNYEDPTPGISVPVWTDANGDGINDAYDNDRDGVINSLDLDSDGDGIADLVEAGGVDVNGDGHIDSNTDGDGDGLLTPYDASNGGVDIANLDTDGDLVLNFLDLDSDNDGIPDVREAGGTDANNDGKLDGTADDDGDGLLQSVDSDANNDGTAENTGIALVVTGADANNDGRPDTYARANMDANGLPNPYDLDSDGDGITDSREAGIIEDTNGSGVVGSGDTGFTTYGTDGWSDQVASRSSLVLPNTDNSGNANFLDTDSDDDGIPDNIEAQSSAAYGTTANTDPDGDGITGTYDNLASTYGGNASNGLTPVNTDGDALPDFLDLDSDNDGYFDRVEGHDTNGDNLPNANAFTKNGVGGTTDADGDGLLDGYDNNTAAVNATNGTTPGDYPNVDNNATTERDWREVADTDGDGLSNLADVDDDNDGIADVAENGNADAYGDADSDGLINYLDASPGTGMPAWIDATGDGINDNYDVDGDTILNSLDLDSDNDGIADLVEAGGVDTNGDGVVDFTGTWAANDSDNDGLINLYDSTPIASLDTDGDGVRNAVDLDSDNDGIPDVVESGGNDANNDGRLDDYLDMDGDGFANAVDGDSDGNRIAENTAGALIITGADANGDGRPDAYTRANFDNTGMPNAYDLDSDADGVLDVREAGLSDANADGVADGAGGSDGWSDAIDALAALVPANSDRTGGPDYLDVDADNDGLTDNTEAQGAAYLAPANADTDNDGIDNVYDNNDALFGGGSANGIVPVNTDGNGPANLLDLDSDNDGIPDLVEAGGVDTNGDGVIDTNADTDGDGLMNPYDVSNGGVNVANLNSDGDALPNYLDIDSDQDGIADVAEAGGVDVNGDGRLDNFNDGDADGFDDTVDGDVGNDGVAENSLLALVPTSADTNGDGRPESYPRGLSNTDRRGLPNAYDLDSDDDGLADVWEAFGTDSDNNGRQDGTTDADGDGLLDARDGDTGNDGVAENTTNALLSTGADANNDGRADSYGKANADADPQPNPYDVDADNDGVPDLMESGGVDTNGDGRIDAVNDADTNGWQNRYDVTAGGQNLKTLDYNGAVAGGSIFDLDLDGIPNPYDLDSENDGLPDVAEAGGADSNGDGRIDNFNDTDLDGFDDSLDPDIGNDGTIEGPAKPLFFTGADTDNDGIPNSFPVARVNPDFDILPNGYDLDSDDDGLPDLLEAGGTDTGNDGRVDFTTSTFAGSDADSDGLINIYDGDANNDGIAENTAALLSTGPDADDNGKADSYGKANADGDAFANPYDLDSDDDGIPDLIEQGGADASGDGMADSRLVIDANLNGWQAAYEPAAGGFALRNIDVNGTAGGGLIYDFDGDGVPNFLDLDSDGDGIPDLVEQGGNDTDNDAKVNTTADVDSDGFKDAYDRVNNASNTLLGSPLITTGATNAATRIPVSYSTTNNWDGNALPNFLDLDSDGDGILDVREAGLAEGATEGQVAGVRGADGWSDDVDGRTSLALPDTDGDGRPDYLDIDADNDGLTDNIEGQATPAYLAPLNADGDWDGIDDQYDNNTAAFAGNGSRDIVPVNTDNADLPDFLDLDSDNDTDPDLVEGNDLNANKKADDIVLPLATSDSDGDGLLDFFDLTAGPRVTIAGFGAGTGGRSPAQQTLLTNTDRDWRDRLFNFTIYTILPVRFVAVQLGQEGKATLVSWIVADEVNVSHYLVERSTDGVQFSVVGSVAYTAGHLATQNRYEWLDGAAPSGPVFYRVRQVDTDGDVQYSAVVARYNNTAAQAMEVFPNPLTQASRVQVTVQKAQTITLQLFAADGRLVRQQQVPLVKGANSLQFLSYGFLAPGTYLLCTQLDGQLVRIKLVKP